MSKDRDDKAKDNSQQSGGGSSGGGNLPKSDPDLSDYHKRGGDNPHIVRR